MTRSRVSKAHLELFADLTAKAMGVGTHTGVETVGAPSERFDRSAGLSADRRHRYQLTRTWSDAPPAMFIGINPSIADEVRPDPTLTRFVGFARSWGDGGVIVGNLFSLIDADPAAIARLEKIGWGIEAGGTGSANDEHLEHMLHVATRPGGWNAGMGAEDVCPPPTGSILLTRPARVVVCWGAKPWAAVRAYTVLDLLRKYELAPMCFGANADGTPIHPLYLPYSTPLVPYPVVP